MEVLKSGSKQGLSFVRPDLVFHEKILLNGCLDYGVDKDLLLE